MMVKKKRLVFSKSSNESIKIKVLGVFMILFSFPLILLGLFVHLSSFASLIVFFLVLLGILLAVVGVGVFQMLPWTRRFASVLFVILLAVYILLGGYIFLLMQVLAGLGGSYEGSAPFVWGLVIILFSIIFFIISFIYLKKEEVSKRFSNNKNLPKISKTLMIFFALGIFYLIFLNLSFNERNSCFRSVDLRNLEYCMLVRISDITSDNSSSYIELVKEECSKDPENLLPKNILEDPINMGDEEYRSWVRYQLRHYKEAEFTERDFCYFYFARDGHIYTDFYEEDNKMIRLSLCGVLDSSIKRDICLFYSFIEDTPIEYDICNRIMDVSFREGCYLYAKPE